MNRRDVGSNTTNGEEGCGDETAEKYSGDETAGGAGETGKTRTERPGTLVVSGEGDKQRSGGVRGGENLEAATVDANNEGIGGREWGGEGHGVAQADAVSRRKAEVGGWGGQGGVPVTAGERREA